MSKLRIARQKKGISLSAFSRQLGIHYSHACQIELGNMRAATKWQEAFSAALDGAVADYFTESGFARPEGK